MLVIYACLAGAASSVGELGKGTPDLHQGVGCPCPQPGIRQSRRDSV
jgi:hypothetical protein